MNTDLDSGVAFYDGFASRYDAELMARPADRLARRAFVDLVSTYAPAGSTVLDFGCGTGLDAAAYVQRGFRVLAYDPSAGMMGELRRRCGADIAARRVLTFDGPYCQLLDQLAASPRPAAVAANFAVLNMVDDPGRFFADLAARLAPPGWMFVSVLNPAEWRGLVSVAFWRHQLRGRGRPMRYRTDRFATYLHGATTLLAAAPAFHLVGRATAGRLVRFDTDDPRETRWWSEADAAVTGLKRLCWRTPLSRFLGTFLMLVLRRDR